MFGLSVYITPISATSRAADSHPERIGVQMNVAGLIFMTAVLFFPVVLVGLATLSGNLQARREGRAK